MAEVKNEVVKASLKDLQMAPRKVGEVVALIRNRTVDDAVVILSHTPRASAKPILKLVESARANAVNNHGFDTNGLVIEAISVTSGPRMKRYKPVARGMAHPFQKRTSHVYITITGNMKLVKKAKEDASRQSLDVSKAQPKTKDQGLKTKATKGAK